MPATPAESSVVDTERQVGVWEVCVCVCVVCVCMRACVCVV